VSRPSQRMLRSYGPLLAVALAFVIMATTVSAKPRERVEYAGSVEVPDLSGPGAEGGDDGGPGAEGTSGGTTGGGQQRGGSGEPTGEVSGCGARTRQIAGDPYSPPCYAFEGGNGGATSKGVTEDKIVITVRRLEGPSAAEIFADISGQSVNDSPSAYEDTVLALAEYFSSRFQFYGRKLDIRFFRGEGNGATELLGGGKEKALADAVRAAQEHGAFADISGITMPYADALARNGVVNFGAPYPSSKWFEDRRPYSWSLFPDGTNVVYSSAAATIGRLSGSPNADYAGPSMQGKPRVYAVVAPENAEYQESVNKYLDLLGAAGIQVRLNMKYKLDISSMPNQASNIIAQLKWSHAFGIAYNAESEPLGRSFPYAAYKSVRPNDEPAFGVEEIYYQMYLLAIGVQMAGPNLTPQTLEAGMFQYPDSLGPRGRWGFGPGDYTPTDDFREIWWDPDRISAQNNKAGAWVQLGGGARYTAETAPRGPAPFFEEG
jgi:hypothetical protein